MFKFSIILLFILIHNYNLNAENINIYETSFHNVNVNTTNTSKTKIEQIEVIKKKSFNNIIDKILIKEDKKKFLKNFNYSQYFDKIVLITSDKYIADIKINFDKKEIIQILRNNNISYSDIISKDILLISTYSEDFINIGLSNKNIFYDNMKLYYSDNHTNLFNFILPQLDPNDRFIITYKKIINFNKKALHKISNKYQVEEMIIIQLYKLNEYTFEVTFNYFNSNINSIIFINKKNFINDSYLYEKIFILLNNWWKTKNIINNHISTINCNILSTDYNDLIYIKSNINKLSQIISLNILSIELNNNFEEIKFYGDYSILKKSLSLSKINIIHENECIIKSEIK